MATSRRRRPAGSDVDRANDAINNTRRARGATVTRQALAIGSKRRASAAVQVGTEHQANASRGSNGENASKRAKRAVQVQTDTGKKDEPKRLQGSATWNTSKDGVEDRDKNSDGSALPLVEDDVIDGTCDKENFGTARVALALGAAQDGLVIHKRMSVQRSKQVLIDKVSEGGKRHVVCRPAITGKGTAGRKGAEGAFATARSASPNDVLAIQSIPTMPTIPIDSTGGLENAPHGNTSNNKRRTHRTRSRVAAMNSGDTYSHSRQVNQAPPTINSLPEDCLRQIFKNCASDEERSSALFKRNPLLSTLPLVCKKWRAILDSPNDAWSTLVIDLSTSLDYGRMRDFMMKRVPSIRHVTLTNERRVIRTTAQCNNWVTMLTSLEENITSTWESLRIENARVYELIDFFLLTPPARPDSSSALISIEPSRLANLKSLDLNDLSTLPKKFTELMQRLPNLEKVRLSFDSLVADGTPAFDGCDAGKLPEDLFDPRLKSLTIRCKYITSIPEAWLNRMANLEELELECMVTKQTFPGLHGLSKLKKLGVTGSTGFFGRDAPEASSAFNPLLSTSLTERMFVLFKSIPTLEELVIDRCGIKEIPMAGNRLASPTVKKLSMNHNPDMVFKKGLSLFHGLEHLSMRRCNMPCVSSAVTGLVNLRYLDISSNGLVECNNLGKLKSLETLIASHNPFPCIPRDIVGIGSLRVIDLSACVYLEFNSSLAHLMDAWPKLARLDVRKLPGGGENPPLWQRASQDWLSTLKSAWDGAVILY